MLFRSRAGECRPTDALTISIWISGDHSVTPPTIGVVDVLETFPSGWKATALTSWQVVRPRVMNNPQIAQWAPVVDALLAGVFQ